MTEELPVPASLIWLSTGLCIAVQTVIVRAALGMLGFETSLLLVTLTVGLTMFIYYIGCSIGDLVRRLAS